MSLEGDALSDVLRLVQLKACVYFVRDMPAPWGLDIPASATGPLHMVLRGHCLFRCGDNEIVLHAGDAILLPHGTRHQMLDNSSTTPVSAPAVMDKLATHREPVNGERYTRMLCGHFEWDTEMDHVMFRELPEYIVVRNFGNGDANQFKSIVALITEQCERNNPGNSAIADRLGEILFISLLRAWLIDNAAQPGVLATLADKRLARSLRYIHNQAEQDIDVQAMARIAGMSRTSFAVQFRKVMGVTPAAYLTEWRLLSARRLLISSDAPLAHIPDRVGYANEASFARAYKRRFGETPAMTRRNHKHKVPATDEAFTDVASVR